MFEIVVSKKSGDFIETAVCNRATCEVGKSRDSLIRVKGWSVAPRHVRFEKDLAGIFVELSLIHI